MSEPKFTKGPWKHHPYGGYCFFIESESDKLAHRVATITYTDGAHSFHEADAALIASAPEMYEALALFEQAAEAFSNWEKTKGDRLLTQASEKRKAALAKARGET